MALTSYTVQTPPATNLRQYMYEEFLKIQKSIASLIVEANLLRNINVTIEVGPPNSGGAGFRVLRIPN